MITMLATITSETKELNQTLPVQRKSDLNRTPRCGCNRGQSTTRTPTPATVVLAVGPAVGRSSGRAAGLADLDPPSLQTFADLDPIYQRRSQLRPHGAFDDARRESAKAI